MDRVALDFRDICLDPAVRAELKSLEAQRRKALRFFFLWCAAGLVLGPAAFLSLRHSGWSWAAWRIGPLLLIFPIAIGYSALRKLSDDLKQPVLAAIAAAAGMDYVEADFDPPGYPEASLPLFGDALTEQDFVDLFEGHDGEGRRCAVYDARLFRRSGKHERRIFRGQIYWVERRPVATSATVILPRPRLPSFDTPCGLAPVGLDDHPELDSGFAVYSDVAAEARQLLADPAFRSLLQDVRDHGRVYAFVGRDNAVVAVSGPIRFQAGSMLDSTSGEDRVRDMVDDVSDALATLRRAKASLG